MVVVICDPTYTFVQSNREYQSSNSVNGSDYLCKWSEGAYFTFLTGVCEHNRDRDSRYCAHVFYVNSVRCSSVQNTAFFGTRMIYERSRRSRLNLDGTVSFLPRSNTYISVSSRQVTDSNVCSSKLLSLKCLDWQTFRVFDIRCLYKLSRELEHASVNNINVMSSQRFKRYCSKLTELL